MSIQKQASLSGLAFVGNNSKTQNPQWHKLQWPELGFHENPLWHKLQWPELGFHGFACVVAHHPDDKSNEIVVVLGGKCSDGIFKMLDSVRYLNVGESNPQWKEAPRMNRGRAEHASAVCNGSIYVIGGTYDGLIKSSGIEKITITDLLETTMNTNEEKKCWTTLKCRLSDTTSGCAAAVVRNRFIVVAGGTNFIRVSSTVNIIDTVVHDQHVVTCGPRLADTIDNFGMAVIGRRVYAVGSGYCLKAGRHRDTMQSWEFDEDQSGVADFHREPLWKVHHNIFPNHFYRHPHFHAVTTVGSCLVVAGGGDCPVKVIDTKRHKMWSLPSFPCPRSECHLLTLSTGVVSVRTGYKEETVFEALSLMDRNTAVFAGLMSLPRITGLKSLHKIPIRKPKRIPKRKPKRKHWTRRKKH